MWTEKEKDIQTGILDYLNLFGIAVKTGQVAVKMTDAKGSVRFVRSGGGYNQGRGWPDIAFCYRDRVYLIEVKRPGEKLNANQLEMHEALLTKTGVRVFILHSVDEAESMRRSIDAGHFTK